MQRDSARVMASFDNGNLPWGAADELHGGLASADAHIIPPDVSRTLRAPAKSSLMSLGREVRQRLGRETSGSDTHLTQGDRLHGCVVIDHLRCTPKGGAVLVPGRRSRFGLDAFGEPAPSLS